MTAAGMRRRSSALASGFEPARPPGRGAGARRRRSPCRERRARLRLPLGRDRRDTPHAQSHHRRSRPPRRQCPRPRARHRRHRRALRASPRSRPASPFTAAAPASRDTALLEPEMTVEEVDAIVLSGGSAFGLDAAGGVHGGAGRAGARLPRSADVTVPIVPQAILFDLLNGGDKAWGRKPPYLRSRHAAACEAGGPHFALGTAGAGYGATTGDAEGRARLGQRRHASRLHGRRLVVGQRRRLVADRATARISGPRPTSGTASSADSAGPTRCRRNALDPASRAARARTPPSRSSPPTRMLTKAQAKRLAMAAHDGLARAHPPGPHAARRRHRLRRRHRPAARWTTPSWRSTRSRSPRPTAWPAPSRAASTRRAPCPFPARFRPGRTASAGSWSRPDCRVRRTRAAAIGRRDR